MNRNKALVTPIINKILVIVTAKWPRLSLLPQNKIKVIKQYTVKTVNSAPKPIQCNPQAHCQVCKAGSHSGMGSAATTGNGWYSGSIGFFIKMLYPIIDGENGVNIMGFFPFATA